MLRVLNHSGFQIELPNNLTVSVMFGVHNDCERKDTNEFFSRLDQIQKKAFLYPDDTWISRNADVALCLTSESGKGGNTWLRVPGYRYYPGEMSLKYVDAANVANIIYVASKMNVKDINENRVKSEKTQNSPKNKLESCTQEELNELVITKKAEEARWLNCNTKEDQIEYLLGWPEFDPDPEVFHESRN